MSESYNTISLNILGKLYKIKCPPEKVAELRESAQYLEDKMRVLAQGGKAVGADKVAIIAGLNVTHELLMQKKQSVMCLDTMGRQIKDLQNKIDEHLVEL